LKIGLIVNDIATEAKGYTTTRLGMSAINQGHEVWVIGVGDLIYNTNDTVSAHAHSVMRTNYKSTETYLKELQGDKAKKERIVLNDLDVVLLRNDPSDDTTKRPWAVSAGIIFGRMAMRGGVIVLNDPDGLAKATNKMYFQGFPEEVRPATIITRNRNEVRAFAKEHGGNIVLKPLQGSGGQGVFLVKKDDMSNLNQIVETLTRDGYIIAQEYLPAAAEGDTRLFLMNGQPLRYKGKYAAFRRIRQGDDMRSNVSAGGSIDKATIDETALRISEIVRPKLVADGMFLVGLDIVGEKLMEINVFSPGGLGSAQRFEKVDFTQAVLDALDRKVQYGKFYRRNFHNVDMATL
jgi:glutathione synthase